MGRSEHHIVLSTPASSGLSGPVLRALSTAREALEAAGYGTVAPGPEPRAQLHVDETIAGRPASGLADFFSLAAPRAQDFGARLGGPVGRIVLPVMPYDLLYPKLWRQQAQRVAMPDFAQIAPELAGRSRGWVALAQDILAAFAPRELIVLPMPQGADEILAALLPDLALTVGAGAARPAMPDTAIAMMQRFHRAGLALPARQIARLVQFHARQPQPAPLAAFDALDAARLRKRYQADLSQLAALPGLRIAQETCLPLAAE
ncbi:hypothetical protein [Pseudothioclava nitratireducens]|uniref:hypothetical protein n=1 Tax=Pseudothioclava nitratireducens TaxID=1928646 RepID=UPI0023DCB989|nr:hypothetical protein [Defluviimonas nitratireducens]MDF1621508.1 hypothetical protein [Defluviimonas nitratireducens]